MKTILGIKRIITSDIFYKVLYISFAVPFTSLNKLCQIVARQRS